MSSLDALELGKETMDGLGSGVYYSRPESAEGDAKSVAKAAESAGGLHSLHWALEVGEAVFRRVFNGDERLLRARGKKNSSFRRLAADPDLGMSPSSLWRAVAIYELSRRFPELVQYTHTGVGHISVVLGLPEPDQYSLLRAGEAQRWTRRRLQREAAELRLRRRQGAPVPRSRFLDRLAGLELLACDTFRDEVSRMRVDELEEAMGALTRVRQRLAEVEGRLRQSCAAE
ncbi:MAG TPA: hypothetical protein VHM70_07315 [Polyangiaceae bacterium]|jgi:hypothetical protein|nr:hypothetical protein [Polyangiaceae bacterium]